MPTDPMHGVAQCWRLDTSAQTLVLASFDDCLPFVAYWGRPLSSGEDLAALTTAVRRPIGNNMLDARIDLSICPEEGRGFQGQPGIDAVDAQGRPVFTQFVCRRVGEAAGSLIVEAYDRLSRLTYRASFRASPGGNVIEAEAELQSDGEPLEIRWLSAPVMPVPETAEHFIEFAGRWTQEFGERRVPFTRGLHVRLNRRGRTGQDHFPAIIVPERGTTNLAGEARALHFGFSGVHRLLAEEMADGRRQVQAGIAEPTHLRSGGTVRSQTVHLVFSADGLNGISAAYQDHVRDRIVRFAEPSRPRPVHYNCWEAVYFRHDVAELKELADRAAAIGAERFVLDDGWFGKRDDDTSGLGDWFVDRRKFPEGLTPLIEHVESLGMTFGLWVEPEMVNLDSDLARAHPDWIIMPEGLAQMTGRGQHVLDLTNAAVTDHLFERLDALLSEYRIDYLKWDMNRDLTLAVDREGRGLLRRQTEAVYGLMERLNAAHPRVEIEFLLVGGRAHRLRHPAAHAARLALRFQRCARALEDAAPGDAVPAAGDRRQPCRAAPLPHLGPGACDELPGGGRDGRPHGLRNGPARTLRGRRGDPEALHPLLQGQSRMVAPRTPAAAGAGRCRDPRPHERGSGRETFPRFRRHARGDP